ncbi:MAG TPA: OmpA family protein, partial [Pseudoxanthomonas sp.]|nr:OmpA family protein [Pseudoxanthomonas sp.]
QLNANPAAKATVSGFHDASGDPAANAEIAKQRAMAVQRLLQDGGIAADRIVLDKPMLTEGDGDPKEARRVDISVR